MATTTSYIPADYADLGAWEIGQDADAAAGNDQTVIITADCDGAGTITFNADWAGRTVRIIGQTLATPNAQGKSKPILSLDPDPGIVITANNVNLTIENLLVYVSDSAGDYAVRVTGVDGTSFTFDKCWFTVFERATPAGDIILVDAGATNGNGSIVNCLFVAYVDANRAAYAVNNQAGAANFDIRVRYSGFYAPSGFEYYGFNGCQCNDCWGFVSWDTNVGDDDFAFEGPEGDIIAYNCVYNEFNGDHMDATSVRVTPVGSVATVLAFFQNVTVANISGLANACFTGDFHLVRNSFGLWGIYGLTAISEDFDGDTRLAPYDVGPYDFMTPPTPGFTGTPTSGEAPLDVQFTDTSTDPDNAIAKWFWEFGDGQTSTEQNPNHTYKMPGTYTVKMTVTDIFGNTYTYTLVGYITVRESIISIAGFPVRRCNFILRYANKATQGIGWSVFSGAYPIPEVRVRALRILDSNNQPRVLVPDSRRGLYIEIGLRDGPVGSGLSKLWVDRIDEYEQYPIASIIDQKEHLGVHEYNLIEHQRSHVYFRPYKEELRDDAGFNSEGYPTGLIVNKLIYKNGELEHEAETRDVPIKGYLHYDHKVEGNRLRQRTTTNIAPWKIVRMEEIYNMKDIDGTLEEITMTEDNYQYELANDLLVYLARGATPLLNRRTNTLMTGSIFGQDEGPDGLSPTSLIFAATDEISTTLLGALTSDFTLIFWVRTLTTDPSTVFQCGDLSVVISGTDITVSDATDSFTETLAWDEASWTAIKVSRQGQNFTISQNGALLNTQLFTSIENYGTAMLMMRNAIGELGVDIRLYGEMRTDAQFLYYYNDFINNNGGAVCPLY